MATVFRPSVVRRLDRPLFSDAAINAETYVWSNRLLDLLQGKDAFPSRYLDWPNPRGRDFVVTNRTFLDPLKLTLLSKDTFFGAAGQPPTNKDWPVPRGITRRPELLTWFNDLLTTTLFPTQVPFAQYQWPNPLGRQGSIELRTFLSQLKLQLLGQDTFFGLAGNPNYDWPVPRGRAHSAELRTFLNGLELSLLGQDALPFALHDWPNPAGLSQKDRRALLAVVQNLLALTPGGGAAGTIGPRVFRRMSVSPRIFRRKL